MHDSNHPLLTSMNTQTLIFLFFELVLWMVIPLIIIVVYQRHADSIGHGPSALSDHLFEHRSHGWEGAVRLDGVCINIGKFEHLSDFFIRTSSNVVHQLGSRQRGRDFEGS